MKRRHNDDLDDHFERIWRRCGAIAASLGEQEKSYTYHEHSLHHNSFSSQTFSSLAHTLFNQHQYLSASDLYQKALHLSDGQRGDLWTPLGICLLLLQDGLKALNALHKAILYRKGDAVAWFGLALLYMSQYSDELALQALSNVVRLKGGGEVSAADPILRESFYRIGILLRAKEKHAGAVECFRWCQQYLPGPLTTGDLQLEIDYTCHLKGGESITFDNTAKGRLLQSWIDGKNKTDSLSFADSGEDDSLCCLLRGLIRLRASNLPAAQEALQRGIQLDDRNAALWNALGMLQVASKRHQEAADAFKRASAINGRIPQVWANLACLYKHHGIAGDLSEALKKTAGLTLDFRHIDPILCAPRPIFLGSTSLPYQKPLKIQQRSSPSQ